MNKHTPGPWMFEKRGSRIVDSGNGSSQLLVATVAINTYHDQGAHNARLIAAAPDLLAVLERVLLVADRKTDEFDAARAAIAKAKGE